MWTKKPRVGSSADAPATPLPKVDTARVNADKGQPGANPPQPRRRLAGSHDGMYITEHHRGRTKR